MKNNIITARLTPRFENGRLYFFEGNTFTLAIDIDLKMVSGEVFPLEDNSKIIFTTYDEAENVVETIDFSDIENNRITLNFDTERTAKYPKGKYSYNIEYSGSCVSTLADGNKIIVE